MTNKTSSLMTCYSGWGSFQRMLVKMITPLTSEQLSLPTGSHHWPIGLVVQHLVGNRVWWFHHWMGEGDDGIAPLAHWDPADVVEQEPLDTAEMVTGLETTWNMIAEALSRWTADDLPQVFSPPDVMSEEEKSMFGDLSRQWMIWHVLEHEILHAGELSLALGSYGLPGIYGDV